MCYMVNPTTFIPGNRDGGGQTQKRVGEGSVLCEKVKATNQQVTWLVTWQEPEDETGHLPGHQNMSKCTR